MATMTIHVDDAKVDALREKAARLGVAPEQLITASVDDLIALSRIKISMRPRRGCFQKIKNFTGGLPDAIPL